MKLVKHRLFLIVMCIQLAALSLFPFIEKADAAANDAEGFTIQADRVVGENMKAMVMAGETSGSNAKPMLRITYDSAQIYGMRLTKQFATPGGGTVSITMKASGPVHIKGMQVDASAISFKGACVHAAKVIPNAALEGVTMVAHSMTAANSSLDQLKLQTVNGNGGVQKPGTLKILQELGSMPFEQMNKEIKKITSGQLPLTCEGASEENSEVVEDTVGAVTQPVDDLLEEVTDPLDGTIGKVTDPLEDTVGKVTDPLKDTIWKVTDPLEDTVGKVTDPLKDTIGKVTDPVLGTVDKVATPVEETVGKVTEPVKEIVKETTDTAKKVTEPVVEPVKKTVDETAKTACEKLEAVNGEISKELALELIDKALAENKMLDELCPTDATLTQQLEKWTEGLLDSLGLLSLLGLKPSEVEQLKKLREAILKEPDGSIIEF
jgi:gas vesicle protein